MLPYLLTRHHSSLITHASASHKCYFEVQVYLQQKCVFRVLHWLDVSCSTQQCGLRLLRL